MKQQEKDHMIVMSKIGKIFKKYNVTPLEGCSMLANLSILNIKSCYDRTEDDGTRSYLKDYMKAMSEYWFSECNDLDIK